MEISTAELVRMNYSSKEECSSDLDSLLLEKDQVGFELEYEYETFYGPIPVTGTELIDAYFQAINSWVDQEIIFNGEPF